MIRFSFLCLVAGLAMGAYLKSLTLDRDVHTILTECRWVKP